MKNGWCYCEYSCYFVFDDLHSRLEVTKQAQAQMRDWRWKDQKLRRLEEGVKEESDFSPLMKNQMFGELEEQEHHVPPIMEDGGGLEMIASSYPSLTPPPLISPIC